MGFDIRTLKDFKLPRYRCEHCRGLLFAEDIGWREEKCTVCRIPYQDDVSMRKYLEGGRNEVSRVKVIERARGLVSTLDRLNDEMLPWKPIRVLYTLLHQAHQFIHLTSRGMDFQMLGALRLLAERVDVCVLLSSPSGNLKQEITAFQEEHPPRLEVRMPDAQWGDPHQKVIVIDGLLAITGSANFTTNAWRNAGDDRETIHLHTDVAEVADVNNRYFARHWADFGPQRAVVQTDDVPF